MSCETDNCNVETMLVLCSMEDRDKPGRCATPRGFAGSCTGSTAFDPRKHRTFAGADSVACTEVSYCGFLQRCSSDSWGDG